MQLLNYVYPVFVIISNPYDTYIHITFIAEFALVDVCIQIVGAIDID